MDRISTEEMLKAMEIMDHKEQHTSEEIEEALRIANAAYQFMFSKEVVNHLNTEEYVAPPEVLEAINILNNEENFSDEKIEWAEMIIDTANDGGKIFFDHKTEKWSISSHDSKMEGEE